MELTLNEIGLKYIENYSIGRGKNYMGGDKTSLGQNFAQQYDKLFTPMRYKDIHLLELGIHTGLSLAMWSEYFASGTISGVDINLKSYHDNVKKLEKLGSFKSGDVHVYEYDITRKEFKDLVKTLPQYDIIIDDALHQGDVQFGNFSLLFPLLKRGGYYIIEDIVEPANFMKNFADIFAAFANKASTFATKHKLYPLINKIEKIEIVQNMVIFKKI